MSKTKEIKLDEKTNADISNEYKHYIYLIRPRENVGHNENVYKVGRTKTKDTVSRISSYGKGSELISIRQCINSSYCEKEILSALNDKFEKYKYGNEYFIGNAYEMDDIINDIVKKDRDCNIAEEYKNDMNKEDTKNNNNYKQQDIKEILI